MRVSNSLKIRKRLRRHPFTLVHAFYATMEGFAFTDAFDEDGNWLCRPVKLTAEGIQFLMKYDPDLIPDLPRIWIKDKSKSNSLGKALLIVQVVWFCMNCASRLAERLPLSLLEVSTLAQGLFTLSSYVMWWSKPLNIAEPTWISMDDGRAQDAYALMFVASPTAADGAGDSKAYKSLESAIRSNSPLPQNSSIMLELSWNAARRYGFSPEELSTIRTTLLNTTTFRSVPALSNLFDANGFRGLGSYVRVRAVDYSFTVCIPLIYGSLHFLGSRVQFPTMIEQNLWRIASVVVMLSGVVAAMFDVAVDISESVSSHVPRSSVVIIQRLADIVYYRVIPTVYMFGSGYLLVESIRQLWYLPLEAYVIATWTHYLPHWL